MLKRAHLVFLMLFVLLIAGGYLLADYHRGLPVDAVATYVGRDTCASCHQQEVDLFHGSHHDKAMDYATADSVQGDFNDQEIEHYGVTSRLYRDGDKFMINTEGPDGSMQDFEIKYTFGVEPLQQYMVELEKGRVQVLRVSWDTVASKWFYLSPPDVRERLDPTDPLHWTGITQNWNVSCAECHSTNLQKNFDIASASWSTSWSEIDVSCEACHGPASLHNEIAGTMSPFWDKNHGTGLVNLKTSRNIDQIQTCAPCHSRRTVINGTWKPGCNFDDYHSLQLLSEPLYHADGQIRDEDYVHGSFLQSKMFHNGVKCSDCHDPHSLKLKHSGNNVCTSCHQHPAGKYDTEAHHFHKPGTEGAKCINCHMPSTTYMAVDHRRDHSFRVPRPDLSVKLGTPNACTKCHLDLQPNVKLPERESFTQYLDWVNASQNGDDESAAALAVIDKEMATACEKWYPPESSPPKTSWYPELATAQYNIRNQKPATELLETLAKDSANPAMIRATAAELLSREPGEESYAIAMDLLKDRDTKVIVAAIGTIEAGLLDLQNQQMYTATPGVVGSGMQKMTRSLGELLDHPSFRVRTEAGRALASLAPSTLNSTLPPEQKRKFDIAIEDYRKSLMVMSDTAGAHMQLGGLHELMGKPNQAAESYRTAIRLQPELTGPRSSLAIILEDKVRSLMMQAQSTGGQSEAASKQVQGLQDQIDSLRKKDHELLGIDLERAKDLPGVDSLHYRYAMSSYLQKDMESAEKHLKIAIELVPDQEGYMMGLATFYLQQKNLNEAEGLISKLLELSPSHPAYLGLKRQLDSMK